MSIQKLVRDRLIEVYRSAETRVRQSCFRLHHFSFGKSRTAPPGPRVLSALVARTRRDLPKLKWCVGRRWRMETYRRRASGFTRIAGCYSGGEAKRSPRSEAEGRGPEARSNSHCLHVNKKFRLPRSQCYGNSLPLILGFLLTCCCQ